MIFIYMFTLNVVFFFYSDSVFYTIIPVRLERSVKVFLHWPTEATGSSIPITEDKLVAK